MGSSPDLLSLDTIFARVALKADDARRELYHPAFRTFPALEMDSSFLLMLMSEHNS